MAPDTVRGERGAGAGDDIGHHRLPVDRIGHADYRRLGNVGVAGQHVVDLERGDVDPAPDDHVLGAPGDVQEPVPVEIAEIAGLEPGPADRHDLAAFQQIGGCVLGAADLDLSHLSRGGGPAVPVHDPEVLVEPGRADAADAPFADMVARDHAALAHPVELHELDSVGLLEALVLGDHQRRGRGAHEADAVEALARRRTPTVEQHVHHRRHADRHAGPVIGDPVEEPAVREMAGEDDGAARHQHRHHGQHVGRGPAEGAVFQDPVRRAELPHVDRLVGDPEIVAVVVDHPLRRRRGAGGEADDRDPVLADFRQRGGRMCAGLVEQRLEGNRLPPQIDRVPGRAPDDEPGIEAAGHLRDVPGVHLDVDRAVGDARRQAGEEKRHLLQPVLAQHQDTVARRQAAVGETAREALAQREGFGVGQRPSVLDRLQEHLVRVGLRVPAQQGRDRAKPGGVGDVLDHRGGGRSPGFIPPRLCRRAGGRTGAARLPPRRGSAR